MSNEINNINSVEEAESMIALEEEKKQSIYLDLGKQYFLRHSSDCEPELKSYVDELVACSGTIAEINQRILALKGPTCPTCGMPVNEESFFCSGCGTRLKGEEPAPEEPAASDVVICPQCGSEMKKDMRFCTVCGCPIPDQDNASQASPTQEYIPQSQPEPVEMNEPASVEDIPYYAPEAAPEQDPYYAAEPVAEQDPYYATESVAEQDPYYATEPVAEQDSYDTPDSGAQQRAYVAPEPSNICPVCGAVSAPGISYCFNCGHPLEEDVAPAAQADYGVRRCPNCGFISSDPNMPFCTECGTLLS